MIAFKPTDLPCPVAPATSKCGVLQRSNIYTSFVMVFPMATGNSYLHSWNFFEAITDCIDTVCGFLLGTSIPIVPLPGIGAIIRIFNAASFNAISSSSVLILAIRIPASGIISYKVTVGPTVALIEAILMLNSSNACLICCWFSFKSSMLTSCTPVSCGSSNPKVGNTYCDKSRRGS